MHRYASVEEFERLARKLVRKDPFADGNRLPVSSIKLDAPILYIRDSTKSQLGRGGCFRAQALGSSW